MKTLLKLEYIALFVLGIVMFGQSEYEWWWFLVLFFVPDDFMVVTLFLFPIADTPMIHQSQTTTIL